MYSSRHDNVIPKVQKANRKKQLFNNQNYKSKMLELELESGQKKTISKVLELTI